MAKYILIVPLLIGFILFTTQDSSAQVTIKERVEISEQKQSDRLTSFRKGKVEPQRPYYPNFKRINDSSYVFIKSGNTRLVFEETVFSGLATSEEIMISYSIKGKGSIQDTSYSLASALGEPIEYSWSAHSKYETNRHAFSDSVILSVGAFEDTFVKRNDLVNYADSGYVFISRRFDRSQLAGDTLHYGAITLIRFGLNFLRTNASLSSADFSIRAERNNTSLGDPVFDLWEIEGNWAENSVNYPTFFDNLTFINPRYSFTTSDTSSGLFFDKNITGFVSEILFQGSDPGFALLN